MYPPSLRARRSAIVSFLLLGATTCLDSANAQGGTTLAVSLTPGPSTANGDSDDPAISSDGRYVAFTSLASDIVPGDTNGTYDVFRRDLLTGTTIRISVATAGAEANNYSFRPAISADGRQVAFHSDASNLVAGDTNGTRDCFLHDCLTGVTTRVSLSATGTQADAASALQDISDDGTQVLFLSVATNLVPGAYNGWGQLYVRDLNVVTTELVSKSSAGVPAAPPTFSSIAGTISGDGRWVAFNSFAANLVSGDTNSAHDVFLHDRNLGTTTRVSLTAAGLQSIYGGTIPSLGSDGRFVAFQSVSNDLVANDNNGVEDVFVRDTLLASTIRVSLGAGSVESNGASMVPLGGCISADGRFVAFHSEGTNLVAGDANGRRDVFVRDLLGATTQRASVSSAGGEANQDSGNARITSGGRFVAFQSNATNLVGGDTNNKADIFRHDRYVLQIDGCFDNQTTLRMTSDAMAIGAATQFKVVAGTYATGLALLYFGVDGRDAAGCGIPVPGFGEALLAPNPPPTLLAQAPTVASVAVPLIILPANPALVGAQVFLQAINMAAGPLFESSNALRITISQ